MKQEIELAIMAALAGASLFTASPRASAADGGNTTTAQPGVIAQEAPLYPPTFRDIVPAAGNEMLSISTTIESALRSDGFTRAERHSAGRRAAPAAVVSLRFNPFSGWFFNLGVRHYLIADERPPWNPDISYAFGYESRQPNTHSLIYSSDGPSRFRPDRSRGETFTRIGYGTLAYGYKFQPHNPLAGHVAGTEDDQLNCNAHLRLTLRYNDHRSGTSKPLKKAVSAGCRYVTPSRFFGSMTMFYYPQSGQQQPWDPDFSYGFGYADPRPGGISVQYQNESGNRFPGRQQAAGQGKFSNGTVSVTWTLPFG
jgi:hypothetical protein